MKVSLFVTCMVDTFFPEVGVSMVKLLRRLGMDVDFPQSQTCCGQPAFNSGYNAAALDAAEQLVRSMAGAEAIVTPSGSCAAMVRTYYPSLFQGSPLESEAKAVAAKTYELTEFIVNRLGIVDLGGQYDAKVTYHSSCHMMRGLGVKEPPLKLLHHVKGLELVDLPFADECCGFGGTFAVKMADISTSMADDKIDYARSTGATVLVGSDMACLMHLGGRLDRRGLPLKVMHLAQLLEEATQSASQRDHEVNVNIENEAQDKLDATGA